VVSTGSTAALLLGHLAGATGISAAVLVVAAVVVAAAEVLLLPQQQLLLCAGQVLGVPAMFMRRCEAIGYCSSHRCGVQVCLNCMVILV